VWSLPLALATLFVYLMLRLFFFGTEVAESVVMLEALRTGFITDQRPERHIRVRSFTYDEVCAATHGFEVDRFLGQGGFGQVYRGFLESTNQVGSHASAE
jgi:hypothetical protein